MILVPRRALQSERLGGIDVVSSTAKTVPTVTLKPFLDLGFLHRPRYETVGRLGNNMTRQSGDEISVESAQIGEHSWGRSRSTHARGV